MYNKEPLSVRETNEFASNDSGVNANDEQMANFTQSNNNSNLNAVLAQSFKSVNFARLNNCTFNFYLAKTDK